MTNSWKMRPVVPKIKVREDDAPGWYSRGYLPHFDGGEIPQTITFNLFDALPERVLKKWKAELSLRPDKDQETEIPRRIDAYRDKGSGSSRMSDPALRERMG